MDRGGRDIFGLRKRVLLLASLYIPLNHEIRTKRMAYGYPENIIIISTEKKGYRGNYFEASYRSIAVLVLETWDYLSLSKNFSSAKSPPREQNHIKPQS